VSEERKLLIKQDETLDDLIMGGLKIIQARQGYRFSVDSVILAHFPELNRIRKIVDLGTGNGVIPLLLSHRSSTVELTGIEIQESMVDRARRSVEYNQMDNRIEIIKADIKETANLLPEGFAEMIISNPPFWKKGEGRISKNKEEAIARHEIQVDLEHIAEAAVHILCPGGKLCIIHRADRLPEIVETFGKKQLILKRIRMVHAFSDREARQLLLEAQKNGSRGFSVLPPLIIYDKAGEYGEEIKGIYNRA
jgi:tRNA1Val (adenine37-N6)-methyltransferase